jgi:hypothetical protein
MVAIFTFSSLFAFLNPFQLVQIVRQMTGNASCLSASTISSSMAGMWPTLPFTPVSA